MNDKYLYRVMFKGKVEPSTAMVKDRIYEFSADDITSALEEALTLATAKNWRLVMIAEVYGRMSIKGWAQVKREAGIKRKRK